MSRVAHFNPYPGASRRTWAPARQLCSWWQDLQWDRQDQWYARARVEQARMNKSQEARRINPRCLDDLKMFG